MSGNIQFENEPFTISHKGVAMCSLGIFNNKIEMLWGHTSFPFVIKLIIILISAGETGETKS